MAFKLGEILHDIKGGSGSAIKICEMIEIWNKIIDERVKKNTEAVKIRNRVLHVTTSTAAWANELTYFKRDLIKKFNLKAGGEEISDIFFRSK